VEFPEECVNCDTEPDNECYGWCEETYYFEVIDACVPPGLTSYFLFGPQSDDDYVASRFLIVDDLGQDCVEDPGDDDDTFDDDDDTVVDDDDSGNDDKNDKDKSGDDKGTCGG